MYAGGFLEECVAQIPEFKVFVGKIFVFDGVKAGFTQALHICFELGSCDKIVIALYRNHNAEVAGYVIQDRVEDYHKFLVEVDLFLPVNNVNIDGCPVLKDRGFMQDGFAPVDSIITAMEVLYDVHKVVFIAVVKLYDSENHVKQSSWHGIFRIRECRGVTSADNGTISVESGKSGNCAI